MYVQDLEANWVSKMRNEQTSYSSKTPFSCGLAKQLSLSRTTALISTFLYFPWKALFRGIGRSLNVAMVD